MKRYAVVIVALVLAGTWPAGVAQARNPHCAGGIQYLDQALRDKEKGNHDDYLREIRKAVQQLEMCTQEDPKDLEAIGYLGWAYAEVDSAGPAGVAFARAFEALSAKGDKKKIEVVTANRDHYWSVAFNDGISKINTAQTAYPDFCKEPSGPEETKLKEEAAKQYEGALASLTKASLYKPGDSRTLKNLGAVYGFRCEFEKSEAVFAQALKLTPNDADLKDALRGSQMNRANKMIDDKQYNQAIALLKTVGQGDPKDASVQIGIADAHFRQAQIWSAEALPPGRLEGLKKVAPNDQELARLKEAVADSLRRADFKNAGDAYGKAAELKPDNPDLSFNAALAFQNAGDPASSEKWWRVALEKRPGDPDVLGSLGSTLADQKKFDDAIKILHQAVVTQPKNKSAHRQLGAVYTKAGNTAKGTEELMVFLALQNGAPVADAAAAAKKAAAGSVPAKTMASMGAPQDIYPWEAEREKYETWFYWDKKNAYHFKAGTLVVKSDWSAPDLKTASGAK